MGSVVLLRRLVGMKGKVKVVKRVSFAPDPVPGSGIGPQRVFLGDKHGVRD